MIGYNQKGVDIMWKKSSFTLTELIIVLIVLAILAAVGIPIYQYTVEKEKIDLCTANLELIFEALKMYELDNDSLPDSLAKAWEPYGDKALAVVWERKKKEGNYLYLAYMSFQGIKYFLANIFSLNPAYAHFSDFCADTRILKCPADDTPFDGRGNFSYGINAAVIECRWEDIPAGALIVGDCESAIFDNESELEQRHRRGWRREAEVIDRDGGCRRSPSDDEGQEEGGVTPQPTVIKPPITPLPGLGRAGEEERADKGDEDILGNLERPEIEREPRPQKGGGI